MTGLSSDATTIGIPGVVCLSSANQVMKLSGVATCIVSSQRFKHDINTAQAGLDLIGKLRPVTFSYNGDTGSLGEQYGFIAEEVDELDKRLVVYGTDGLPFSVRYENMTAVLAKGVQELAARTDFLSSTSTLADITLATSTLPTAPWYGSFANASEGLRHQLEVLADSIIHIYEDAVYAADGVFKRVFAQEVHSDKLCVTDATGETCITRSQLDALLGGAAASQQNDGGSTEPSEPPTDPIETPEDPESPPAEGGETPEVPSIDDGSAGTSGDGTEGSENPVEEAPDNGEEGDTPPEPDSGSQPPVDSGGSADANAATES